MEKYFLKTKNEIKDKKKYNKINFGISVKYYLSFIFIIILIMIFFLILVIFSLTKISTAHRKEALNRGRNYMNKCLEGIVNNITFKISKNPKISVIIPNYNSQKTIKATLRSVQNQNIKDIEIIILNEKK